MMKRHLKDCNRHILINCQTTQTDTATTLATGTKAGKELPGGTEPYEQD